MTSIPIAVVSALPEEVAPLVARLEATARERSGGQTLVHGRLGAVRLVLSWTGEGSENARRGTERLLAAAPGAPLLGVGIAGALSPGLTLGEVVAGAEVRGPSGGVRAAPAWLDRAVDRGQARPGALLTVDGIVSDPARKAQLWRELGEPATAVVDMESFHFAAAADRLGRPCLVLRSVSDLAAEALPRFLESCRDRRGGIDRGLVVRRAMLRPWRVPELLRLRSRLALGADRLAGVVARMLAGWADGWQEAGNGRVRCAG